MPADSWHFLANAEPSSGVSADMKPSIVLLTIAGLATICCGPRNTSPPDALERKTLTCACEMEPKGDDQTMEFELPECLEYCAERQRRP